MKKHLVIKNLERFIQLERHRSGHFVVKMMGHNGRWIKQLTSISCRSITSLQYAVIIIHCYQVFCKSPNNAALKRELEYLNFASIFGTPWGFKRWD